MLFNRYASKQLVFMYTSGSATCRPFQLALWCHAGCDYFDEACGVQWGICSCVICLFWSCKFSGLLGCRGKSSRSSWAEHWCCNVFDGMLGFHWLDDFLGRSV